MLKTFLKYKIIEIAINNLFKRIDRNFTPVDEWRVYKDDILKSPEKYMNTSFVKYSYHDTFAICDTFLTTIPNQENTVKSINVEVAAKNIVYIEVYYLSGECAHWTMEEEEYLVPC